MINFVQVYVKLRDLPSILLIDNYDSFTYNLYHYLEELGATVDVCMNDSINLEGISDYDAVVLSPGPGLPEDAGELLSVIEACKGHIPVFGVCLGMQALAQDLGGEIYNQKTVKHGVHETVRIDHSALFNGLEDEIEVGLYHSWAVRPDKGDFNVTAVSLSGVVMALENKGFKFYGVQFHPESIMTPAGKTILMNFLDLCS